MTHKNLDSSPKALKIFLFTIIIAIMSLSFNESHAKLKNPETKANTKTSSLKRIMSETESDTTEYGTRNDVMQFAATLTKRHGWPEEWARSALQKARFLPKVTQLIMPPPPTKPKDWAAYRARFIEPKRIKLGKKFWLENEKFLNQATKQWGVPAELVVGIIGVETMYGQFTGSFKVIDALATLAFSFPANRSDRSEFFKSELEQFLILCHREQVSPGNIKGSFAGAIGLPQFMPSSINRYAIDFDSDGHINLLTSAPDAIGSVANYLAEHGWQTGMPTHYTVIPPTNEAKLKKLLEPDIKPSFTASEMLEHGAKLDEEGSLNNGPLALVELLNGTSPPSYIAGTQNFYTITRYNWSSYYALAVIELGQSIKQSMSQP